MRRAAPTKASARLRRRIRLEAQANGEIIACFDGHSVGLGTFSAAATDRGKELHKGLPLSSISSARRNIDKELGLLVRRLAAHGLLEYRLGRSRGSEDLVVIEPMVADYWPQAPQLGNGETLVLSRFAFMRRRGAEMVVESPRAGALFKICDPKIAAAIAMLSTPQQIKALRRQEGFPGVELLALLLDSQILFKVGAGGESGLRLAEGDHSLALWDFHDLVFHTRSTKGRHGNPLGGVYPYAGVVSPLPAVRPSWPGKKVDLRTFSAAHAETTSPVATLLRERHSTRSFDDQRSITLAELAQFLDGTARVLSRSNVKLDLDGDHTVRPYPSAGATYELELYLAVNLCEGLARGFYHYDAGAHVLAPIGVLTSELQALLAEAEEAMGVTAAPQILITIAARFGRISWKYSSIAYALILKDVGVLTQTLYLTATDMGLGGCGSGSRILICSQG
jgi:SagB-type dehydrogenase family enzyme